MPGLGWPRGGAKIGLCREGPPPAPTKSAQAARCPPASSAPGGPASARRGRWARPPAGDAPARGGRAAAFPCALGPPSRPFVLGDVVGHPVGNRRSGSMLAPEGRPSGVRTAGRGRRLAGSWLGARARRRISRPFFSGASLGAWKVRPGSRAMVKGGGSRLPRLATWTNSRPFMIEDAHGQSASARALGCRQRVGMPRF